ncbi:MAG: rhodanese-like domain-containing protein [Clostridia bacterium]|nr:rhodanese-like domain-containing protein [Clostridia bacterium]
MKKLLLLILCFCMFFSGCGKGADDKEAGFMQITQDEAKSIMDKEDCVILDVREQYEFDEGHIEGAILIPHEKIAFLAEGKLPDKDETILVYCRSGRRSKIASEELVKLGYTNVKEFGGIIYWTYEVVK